MVGRAHDGMGSRCPALGREEQLKSKSGTKSISEVSIRLTNHRTASTEDGPFAEHSFLQTAHRGRYICMNVCLSTRLPCVAEDRSTGHRRRLYSFAARR